MELDTVRRRLSISESTISKRKTDCFRLTGAAAVQGKLLASANWASQKLLDQSRAMQARTEAGQPVNISPQMAARVKMARR